MVHSLVVCIVAILAAQKGLDERLPVPNFEESVDYVGWVRSHQLPCEDAENAQNEYSLFFQKECNPRPDFLRADPAVEKLIASLVSNPRLWDANELPELNRYLAGLMPFIGAYETGAKRRCFRINIDENIKHISDVLSPHLGNSKVITKAMITLAWQKEQNSTFDIGNFAGKLTSILRHTAHLEQGISLVEKLCAIRGRHLVYISILAAANQDLLDEKGVAEVETFLAQYDAKDGRYGLCTIGEQAFAFDLLQDMCKHNFLGFGPFLRAKFNKSGVLYWLQTFGYLDHPGRSIPIADILSKDPRTIAQEIESYYTECSRLLEARRGGNCVDDLRKLHETYSSKHCYFQLFPLTDFSKVYQEALQVERTRRLNHLVICLLIHYQKNKVFPADFSFLGNGEDETITTDPVTGARFAYRSVEKVAEISSPEVGVFKSLTIRLR